MPIMKEAPSGGTPSPWVTRFAALIPQDGHVLDLACGGGRHTRFLLRRGHRVVALDRDVSGVQDLGAEPDLEIVETDLEDGGAWPLANRLFSGIIVINYLFRPLFPTLLDALDRGGVLIYETFAAGNERFGRPANPAFLLEPGELLDVTRGTLRIVAFEDGIIEQPRRAAIQRICAIRTTDDSPPLIG